MVLGKRQGYRIVIRTNCATPAVIYWRMPATIPGGYNFGSVTPT
jgi:hypothetical protein